MQGSSGSSPVHRRWMSIKICRVQILNFERKEVSRDLEISSRIFDRQFEQCEHDLLSNKSQCLCTNGVYKQALFCEICLLNIKSCTHDEAGVVSVSLGECLLKKISIKNSSNRIETWARRPLAFFFVRIVEILGENTLYRNTLVEVEIPTSLQI